MKMATYELITNTSKAEKNAYATRCGIREYKMLRAQVCDLEFTHSFRHEKLRMKSKTMKTRQLPEIINGSWNAQPPVWVLVFACVVRRSFNIHRHSTHKQSSWSLVNGVEPPSYLFYAAFVVEGTAEENKALCTIRNCRHWNTRTQVAEARPQSLFVIENSKCFIQLICGTHRH